MTNPTCPKCNSKMDEGFIIDTTYGARLQSEWTEGKPQRSLWTGLKVARDSRYPVATFRCVKCGYLESYTRFE